ncbi:hypothetical protein MLD52_06130 [Puniceicoccaceae bacterium K14]|nr:hypothetical protein [Puniceicoccaceae bacterium K14]
MIACKYLPKNSNTLISFILLAILASKCIAQTIYVDQAGNDDNTGLRREDAVKTVQRGLDLLKSNKARVLTVAPGTYYETLKLEDYGSSSERVWIKAETPGTVSISNMWEAAERGNVYWIDDGDGVYYTSRSQRPYMGSYQGDFLMHYHSKGDLVADSVTRYANIANDRVTVSKPPYGFAFENDRIYLRLRNREDPNGKRIKLTASFSQNILTLVNCQYVYVDGFNIEGAGATRAVELDKSCDHITVRNCNITASRIGIQSPSNTFIEYCTYGYTGFGEWCREVSDLDGRPANGVYVIVKGYFTGASIYGDPPGNALLEGGINGADLINPTPSNVVIDHCVMGPAFDGARLGTGNYSTIRNSVFIECRDDGVQNESSNPLQSATSNRIHDCKFLNCFRDISVQGSNNVGDFHAYRNVFIWDDFKLSRPGNHSLKMITTDEASKNYFYQNTWHIDYGRNIGGTLGLWSDFEGPKSDADKIHNFFNNLIVIPREYNDGPGPDPRQIEHNVVVGTTPKNVEKLLQGYGIFAGSHAADMKLNPDLSLKRSSPARKAGRPLPDNFPDSRSGNDANADAGAFPYQEKPGADWPRPLLPTYTISPPPTF